MTDPACMCCGCTEADCRGCVERTGSPCSWVAPYLCSACVEDVCAVGDRYVVRDRRGVFDGLPAAALAVGRFAWGNGVIGAAVPAAALWVYVRADVFDLVKRMAEQGRIRL